ncbi:MAG TPA: kelch repeat-containing protein [Polyangiaceae bacterium]|jgi:hypothetical protein
MTRRAVLFGFVAVALACGARTPLAKPAHADAGPTGQCVLYEETGTWLWDAGTWNAQSTTIPTPPECSPHACGYVGTMVTVDGHIELVGTPAASDATVMETWLWTGDGWTQQATSGAPPARFVPAVASLGDSVVLFGGLVLGGSTFLDDTWVLHDGAWAPAAPPSSPSARAFAGIAGLGSEAVLFGGADDSGSLGDTWIWNGSTWTLAPATIAPAARSGAAMTADGDGIILFGGCVAGGYTGCEDVGTPSAETWRWDDATSWTLLHPTTSPSARTEAVAASFQNGALLFGGLANPNESVTLGDTWTWDGTTWSAEIAASAAPGSAALGCN